MLSLLQSQLMFYLAIALVLFLPGYSLLLAIFGKNKILNSLEKFILSFGLSIICIDFIFFVYPRLALPINRLSAFGGIILFSAIALIIYKFRTFSSSEARETENLFQFSKIQFGSILLLIFLAFFIKTAFLSQAVLPTATDMGHHMYWTQWITENQTLPDYGGLPDFIIGEHVIFAIISLISGLNFFSAFPVLLLYLVNIFSLLTIFILVLRIFQKKQIALLVLFLLGTLFAIASPQTKFVSGGVIGNLLGNLFIPTAFYFFFRFSELLFTENQKKLARTFLVLALVSIFGLFYTHHLTAFLFLFVFSLALLAFLLVNYKKAKEILIASLQALFSHQVFPVILFGLVFFLFILTPNYFSLSATQTAVGAAVKATRTGLDLNNIRSAVGESRLALGAVGFLLLLLALRKNKQNFGYVLISAWALMLYIMSSYPKLLFINLPSSRIGNYLTYPLAILSAYALFQIFQKLKNQLPANLAKITLGLILIFVLREGISDSVQAFKIKNESSELIQTFDSSAYVAANLSEKDMVLKDHNYLTGDAWIKLFFMRDYKFPLSRGYFQRYEDPTNPRETCTLEMISNPGGTTAQKCFSETGVDFIMVNPTYDSGQFHRLNNFDQVYVNSDIVVFYKNN
ncbi:DUF1616 domain-containing protein [Patescibacteria group bacterium]|nr:DUF1616 domain-containing protein [Patescibacteria group bacterium]